MLSAADVVKPLAAGPRFIGAAVTVTRDEVVSLWNGARTVPAAGQDSAKPGDPPSADAVYLAWYAGLGAMTALRFIDWPLAAVIAAAHTVERYGHRQRVREFVEGLDSGF